MQVMTTLDDVDKTPAEESVPFGLDGVNYIIDLSSTNAQALRADLARWIAHARKDTSRTPRRPRAVLAEAPSVIRRWAQDNGLDVNTRGRIPESVVVAYRKFRESEPAVKG